MYNQPSKLSDERLSKMFPSTPKPMTLEELTAKCLKDREQ